MMNGIDLYTLIGIGAIICLAILAIYTYVYCARIRTERQEALDEMKQTEEEEHELPEPVACNARVLEKRFASDVIGTKSVKQVSSYYVTFFTEDDETVKYAVPEEIFLRIEQGQESTLVTVDGEFLDFGEGEDAPTKES